VRLNILLAIAASSLALAPVASAGPTPKGWITKGPKENRERVHRATGLSCSAELLPEMTLTDFGFAKTVAPGKPFCAFERSGDVVRVYVLGRSQPDPMAIERLADTEGKGSALAQQAYPVFQTIDVVSKDSQTNWTGIAFDLSKGKSQTPDVSSLSFASINGWDVRLDIDYKVTNWKDPGPKSQEPELRDAMAYLLAATLRRKK
jgi:hypothetical protein